MQTFTYSQDVNEFFITPGRTKQALILCQNSKGEFILGKKTSYPEGISRMVGGGIDINEDVLIGTKRELKEELSIDAIDSDLKELCLIQATFTKGTEQQNLDIYVYFYNIGDLILTAGDDVADFAYLNAEDLNDLINKLEALTGTYPDKYGKASEMLWSDWAKLHSFVLKQAISSYELLD